MIWPRLPVAEHPGPRQFDLYEDQDNGIVQVKFPALKKEEIQVSPHNGVLSISGSAAQSGEEKVGRAETQNRFGTLRRTVSSDRHYFQSEVKGDPMNAQ